MTTEKRPCCVMCVVPGTVPQECCDPGCHCKWYDQPVYTEPEKFVQSSETVKEVKVLGWAGKNKS